MNSSESRKTKKLIDHLRRNMIFLISGICAAILLSLFSLQFLEYRKESLTLRDRLINEKKDLIQSDVEQVLAMIASVRASLTLSDAEMQEYLRHYLSSSRGMDQERYVFIKSFSGEELVNPANPELIGRNIWDLEDAQGNKVVQNLVREGKKPEGGFVRYNWGKPSTGKPMEKISFVKPIPGWQWILGTGVYLDEVETLLAEKAEQLKRTFARQATIVFFSGLIAVGLMLLLMRRLSLRVDSEIRRLGQGIALAESQNPTLNPENFSVEEFCGIAAKARQVFAALEASEAKLQDSETRYRSIFENNFVAMLTIDPDDGAIVDANPAATSFSGWSRDDLRNMNIREIIVPGDAEGAACAGQGGRQFAFQHRRADGSMRDVELFCGPLGYGKRNLVFYIVMDVTERKRAQEQLALALSTMEAERSDALAMARGAEKARLALEIVNHDLVAQKALAKEMETQAKAASRAKSEFLANMSHEIRTPLNGVLGMLQLLKMTRINEEQADYVQRAALAGKSLLSLLSDILDLSRIEAGRMHLLREPFALDSLVETVMNCYREDASAKDLVFDAVLDKNLPEKLIGDHRRLNQILSNLIGNAVKFTPQGRVRLSINASANSGEFPCDNAITLEFRVEDTGIGISKELQDDVFSPFIQEEGDYQRKFQGAGLGLAIVKQLVQLMDGRIELKSHPGVGSTFTLYIPFALEKKDKPFLPQLLPQREGISAQGPSIFENMRLRLLLAEDNKINQLMAARMLTKHGHEVVCVENGKMVIAELRKREFDLILMDIQMPEMDGLEATRLIREDQSHDFDPQIPIIALTAYAMPGDKERFLTQGMDGYLAKPFEFKDLTLQMEMILEKGMAQP